MKSRLVEDEAGAAGDQGETDRRLPFQRLAKIDGREDDEDRQGDDFLDGLELCRGKGAVADPVGRHLEAVFKKGDAPAYQNDHPQLFHLELEVAIPGQGHEQVGADKQANGGEGGRNFEHGKLRTVKRPAS